MIQYFNEHKNTQKTKNGENSEMFFFFNWFGFIGLLAFYGKLELEMGQPTSYLVMFTSSLSLFPSLALMFIVG